jgi:hypothetical protein
MIYLVYQKKFLSQGVNTFMRKIRFSEFLETDVGRPDQETAQAIINKVHAMAKERAANPGVDPRDFQNILANSPDMRYYQIGVLGKTKEDPIDLKSPLATSATRIFNQTRVQITTANQHRAEQEAQARNAQQDQEDQEANHPPRQVLRGPWDYNPPSQDYRDDS